MMMRTNDYLSEYFDFSLFKQANAMYERKYEAAQHRHLFQNLFKSDSEFDFVKKNFSICSVVSFSPSPDYYHELLSIVLALSFVYFFRLILMVNINMFIVAYQFHCTVNMFVRFVAKPKIQIVIIEYHHHFIPFHLNHIQSHIHCSPPHHHCPLINAIHLTPGTYVTFFFLVSNIFSFFNFISLLLI